MEVLRPAHRARSLGAGHDGHHGLGRPASRGAARPAMAGTAAARDRPYRHEASCLKRSDCGAGRTSSDGHRRRPSSSELLVRVLLEVVERLRPGVVPRSSRASHLGRAAGRHLMAALQAWASGSAAREHRRRARRDAGAPAAGPRGGADYVAGTFAHELSRAAALGIDPEQIAETLSRSLVAPTLTAHPTEAKRVTVLEIHGGST